MIIWRYVFIGVSGLNGGLVAIYFNGLIISCEVAFELDELRGLQESGQISLSKR